MSQFKLSEVLSRAGLGANPRTADPAKVVNMPPINIDQLGRRFYDERYQLIAHKADLDKLEIDWKAATDKYIAVKSEIIRDLTECITRMRATQTQMINIVKEYNIKGEIVPLRDVEEQIKVAYESLPKELRSADDTTPVEPPPVPKPE